MPSTSSFSDRFDADARGCKYRGNRLTTARAGSTRICGLVAGNGQALRSRGLGAAGAGRPVPDFLVLWCMHGIDYLAAVSAMQQRTLATCESTVQLGPCHGVTVPETPDRPEEVRAVKLAQSLLAKEAAACKLIRKGRASQVVTEGSNPDGRDDHSVMGCFD